MEKERKVKVLSLMALIVAVLGLTVAFAALSQTLTINGTASVNAAEWDVHITDLTKTRVDGSAEVISEPTISSDGKAIENLQVSLKKPGDYVRYDYYFENTGTIDAQLTKEIQNGFDLSLFDDASEEEEIEIEKEILKALFPKADWDGDGITTDEERLKASSIIFFSAGGYGGYGDYNSIAAGEKKPAYLEVSYDSEATELPKGEVVVNFKYEYIYTQK